VYNFIQYFKDLKISHIRHIWSISRKWRTAVVWVKKRHDGVNYVAVVIVTKMHWLAATLSAVLSAAAVAQYIVVRKWSRYDNGSVLLLENGVNELNEKIQNYFHYMPNNLLCFIAVFRKYNGIAFVCELKTETNRDW